MSSIYTYVQQVSCSEILYHLFPFTVDGLVSETAWLVTATCSNMLLTIAIQYLAKSPSAQHNSQLQQFLACRNQSSVMHLTQSPLRNLRLQAILFTMMGTLFLVGGMRRGARRYWIEVRASWADARRYWLNHVTRDPDLHNLKWCLYSTTITWNYLCLRLEITLVIDVTNYWK